MEVAVQIILLAVVAAGSAIPFRVFHQDAKHLAGTSTFTNILLYRKLLDENKLTRMRIQALNRQRIQDMTRASQERMDRWERSQIEFQERLAKRV